MPTQILTLAWFLIYESHIKRFDFVYHSIFGFRSLHYDHLNPKKFISEPVV
jgi:hypothetical protein